MDSTSTFLPSLAYSFNICNKSLSVHSKPHYEKLLSQMLVAILWQKFYLKAVCTSHHVYLVEIYSRRQCIHLCTREIHGLGTFRLSFAVLFLSRLPKKFHFPFLRLQVFRWQTPFWRNVKWNMKLQIMTNQLMLMFIQCTNNLEPTVFGMHCMCNMHTSKYKRCKYQNSYLFL